MKVAIIAMLCLVLPGTGWTEAPLDKDLRIFLEYFEGEFNNYNQVNFETNGFLEQPIPGNARHPWHHHTVRRVEAPAFGEHVFYAQINVGGPRGPVVRQRIHVLEPDRVNGTIRQRFYAFHSGEEWIDAHLRPAALEELTPGSVRTYPEGCEILWRRQVDQFVGAIPRGACRVPSQRSAGELEIAAELALARDEMWHLESGYSGDGALLFTAPGGVPFKLKRSRPFSCWVAFLKDAEADDWDSFRDVAIHDQGGTADLSTNHEQPRHYRLQLKQTVFPASHWPDVLELFVHEQGNERALAYTWTSPDAERIGVNLRWMQAGCRLLAER